MRSKRNAARRVAALAGSAFVTTLGVAGMGHADGQPLFAADDLDGGYLLAAKAGAEGKCGEGKCGAGAEAKATEGKCGAGAESKDSAEGKCGASESKDAAEGKCGGSQGASKDAEGKCGSSNGGA